MPIYVCNPSPKPLVLLSGVGLVCCLRNEMMGVDANMFDKREITYFYREHLEMGRFLG
jgi:hypothetical protein